MRTLVALLGLAVIFAIFAGIHYGGSDAEGQVGHQPAFQMGPGDVQSISIQPSLPGSPIEVTLRITGGPIDVYTLDSTWASTLPARGLRLDDPFPFHSQWSHTNVSGVLTFEIQSDGETWHNLVLDHTDNYYADDAIPTNNIVTVDVTTRFLAEEKESLTLGYLATLPSILLVGLTVVLKLRRRRAQRKAQRD